MMKGRSSDDRPFSFFLRTNANSVRVNFAIKASSASGRTWLLASGQLRVSEAGSGFESLHPRENGKRLRDGIGKDRFAVSEPVPAALPRRWPRSFPSLAV